MSKSTTSGRNSAEDGYGFMHLHRPGTIPQAKLKIPFGVTVEAIPLSAGPTDPETCAQLEAEQGAPMPSRPCRVPATEADAAVRLH